MAARATSIYATGIKKTVIDIAKKKGLSSKQVSFKLADIYYFPNSNKFKSLFVGFNCAHFSLQDLDNFLSTVNSLLASCGTMVFMDKNFIEGSKALFANAAAKSK
jgi:hypothetical protein